MSGIYKIQSICKPNKIYIGSAINIMQRWANHTSRLKLGKHVNIKLQNHYNKYGISDLQFSIIVFQCNKNELLSLEQCFLNSYKPWFNIQKIAGSPLGRTHSQITKDKISLSMKGKVSHRKGKTLSKEHKRKLSENHSKHNKGKHFSEETKLKMSNSRKKMLLDKKNNEKD